MNEIIDYIDQAASLVERACDRDRGVCHEWDYLDDPSELAARRGFIGAQVVA